MNANQSALVDQQQNWLDALRSDAGEIAGTMADQVWDRFEIDIEEATEQGVDFEFVESIATSLASLLALAYDDSFSRHIASRCEQLNTRVGEQGGPNVFDDGSIDLTGMRKGLKLRRHAQGLIEEAIANAKPGLGRMLGIVVGSLFRDPLQEIDAVEKDMKNNAKTLRRELLKLRDSLRALITEESLAAMAAIRVELGRQPK